MEGQKLAKQKPKGNWQKSERDFLIDLISERIEVIISKQTDHGTKEKKEVAWQEISGLFDARFGDKWTLAPKQDLWKRLRINAKKEISAHNLAVRRTGGGPPPPEPSAISLIIKDLCPIDFYQVRNPYDDDAYLNNKAINCLQFIGGQTTPNKPLTTLPTTPVPEEIVDDLEEQSHRTTSELDENPTSSGSKSVVSNKQSLIRQLAFDETPRRHSTGPKTKPSIRPPSLAPADLEPTDVSSRVPPKRQATSTTQEIIAGLALEEHKYRMEVMKRQHDKKMMIHDKKMKILDIQEETAQLERETAQLERENARSKITEQ